MGYDGATVDGATFRSVLAQWPSGVGIVTTLAGDDRQPHGMTASSLTAVSLDPPLVSVCIANHLPTRGLIADSGSFAVSILGKDQAEIGRGFAGALAAQDRFRGATWQVAATGCPVLANATGWVDCRVEHAYPGGDHTIFVGHVLAAGCPRVGAPLLFHSRAWGQLADPLPAAIAIPEQPPHHLVPDAFAPQRESTVLAALAGAFAADEAAEVCLVEESNAAPVQVRRILQDAVVIARGRHLRVRLRAHHGLGLVNALVAMKSGVSRFDATSDGAGGTLRTDDLAYLAAQLGITCARPTIH